MNDGRAHRYLAWGLFALALASCAGGWIFDYLSREAVVSDLYGARGAGGVIAIPFAAVGSLLASRRRRNPIGWLYLAGGLLMGVAVFGEGYATYSFFDHSRSLPLTDPLAWLQNWLWVPLVACGLVYPFLLFPDGRLPSKRWRWLAWIGAPVMLAFGLGIALDPGQLQSVANGFLNPYAVSQATAEASLSILGLPFMAVVVASIVAMARRFRRSVGEEHEQMKWLLFAGSITTLALAANLIVGIVGVLERSNLYQAIAILTQASIGGVAVASGIAVLKYRLYDIDVVISKAVLFGAIGLGIGALYVGVVVGIGAAIGTAGEQNVGLSVAATALVAVAFQPLRNWASRFANRFVYGKRATPHEILSVLGERIAGSYSLDEVLPRLAQLVTEATPASRADVWVRVGGALHQAAAWPHDPGPDSAVPIAADEIPALPNSQRAFAIRHQAELLGAIAVSAPANDPLSSADERLLTDLAAHAGLVVRNVRLIEELRASRGRLVAAQDAERRRIERNLHDGAQQHLVALAVNLRLARGMVDGEPAQATAMLEQLQADAAEALENLRDLARGIYPPLLADRGLAAALQSQAQKAAVRVRLETDGIGRYPMEAESAVYFCVLEALQNVAKYAAATEATVRIGATDGRLEFSVKDDGAGFDERTTRPGSGLTNMTDRVEALGGRLEVRSSPGSGTTVSGWVRAAPVAPPA
jgi:signal transduction histidine kinase